ncbi:15-hydroxyprostaglandin dehydrogenase [Aulographum hederae CBS 113979]|uniref:15-hydroxyprostaglandin dehydrogenase n=1 Tax=Aulographum hederae CBS 113979 TaxID=1176131 RepID=A0A6G1HFW3_9PEZI|nr:15-hydroxyprostaglandin dehydrogenase [Aulographum hederae CBS 113979]
MPCDEKVAIVTGASSGMGLALSRDLVQKGWRVAMTDIRPNAELSRELGDRASFFETNVADYDSQAKTFQAVWDKYGRIDALLANAGIVDRSSIYIFKHKGKDEIPPKPDLSCTDVDYKGVVYGTQLAIHFMRKNKIPGGQIIATVSIAAVHPHETYPEYDGAKAAVLNFIYATARILKAKENISINGVLPGIVHTSIIPPEMITAVSPECLTPVSTIVAAYDQLLSDPSIHGQAIEGSVEKCLLVPRNEVFLNGYKSKRAVTVWEPLFEMNHGEKSGLADAIA